MKLDCGPKWPRFHTCEISPRGKSSGRVRWRSLAATPERFTAALPKARRKGRIFVDYPRNQRRARTDAPLAARITWKETATIDGPSHWHIGNAAELVKDASSKTLAAWGRADLVLPAL